MGTNTYFLIAINTSGLMGSNTYFLIAINTSGSMGTNTYFLTAINTSGLIGMITSELIGASGSIGIDTSSPTFIDDFFNRPWH